MEITVELKKDDENQYYIVGIDERDGSVRIAEIDEDDPYPEQNPDDYIIGIDETEKTWDYISDDSRDVNLIDPEYDLQLDISEF